MATRSSGEPTLFDYESDSRGVLIKVTEPQLTGEMTAEILKLEIERLVRRLDASVVVVDLSRVRMVSSLMIGAFVKLHKNLSRSDGELRQCCIPPVVESVYRTSNLIGTVFSVFATAEEALGPS